MNSWTEKVARDTLNVARIGRVLSGRGMTDPLQTVIAVSLAVLAASALLKEINGKERER